MLPSSQGSIPPAGMLTHRRGTGTVNINMLLRNARYPVRQCGQPLHLHLKKKNHLAIWTQHIKGIIFVFGFHASAKYLTLRHFSHFGTKTFSAPERVQSAVGKISASLQALAPTKQGSYVESNGPEPVHALQQLHL